MPPPFRLTATLVLTAACAGLMGMSLKGPPVAPVIPVVDDYFGAKVTDNYRWMEDRFGAPFTAWAKGQSEYARDILDRIPGRQALQDRIAAHTAGGAAISSISLAGGRVFYMKRMPGENTFKLFVRDRIDGPERVLVDPEKIPTEGPHYAIDYFQPSQDGARLAYGVSPGGSENSTIRVLDVATGAVSPEAIDRTEYGSPSWLSGGKAFVYNRFVKLGPDAKDTDKYLNSRAMLHVVGTYPEKDIPLIGTGVAGSPAVTPVDQPFIATFASSPYVVAVISHGADPDQTYYIARADQLAGGKPAWRKVVDTPDQVADVQVSGERVFLLSHKGAPHYQVLETTAAAPDAASAKVIVAAGPRIVQSMNLSSEALYIKDLDGGLSRIRRLDLAGGRLDELSLPSEGAVAGPISDNGGAEALFMEQGWVMAPTVYRTRGAKVSRTDIIPPWSDDLSPYESREVMATAPDGTKIPLSIVYKKGLKLDGSQPVWLTGYGAYGVPIMPALASRFLTLLDDGGIYAVAHVRGGGEFGEDWHQAGRIATKPNTWNDLIACAEYLVKAGYGTPASLAIEGRSAGGITVGRALTARPDLFRVVFDGVGDNNTLRSENGTDGPANALEYGSVATEPGFRALFESDSVQHVKDGVAYPAVLLTSGMNDPRVAPWQPGKMAARLQAASSSGRPVLFLVDFDAGHGMGSTKTQRDKEMADQLAFFYWQIGRPGYQPSY
jgi:prolyl oligopeptidase